MHAAAGGVTAIFNSTVAGFAIAAAWEIGALDELRNRGALEVTPFCTGNDLDEASVHSMFAALAAVGVVVRDGDRVLAGPHLAEVHRSKAFFHWLTVGCAELFAAMPRIVRNANRVGAYYRRDTAAIGLAAGDANRCYFDPVFWAVMEALDFEVTAAVDLGCGGGGRLTQMVTRCPGARGIGVDIAPAALRSAAEHADAAGVADRVELIQADVRALAPDPRFDDVDLLTCFMMGHDFWPREQCVASLRRLREAFPNARRFLLGDTARTQGIADPDMPIFTLAFEAAHNLMGVYVPTRAEWEGVFDDGGWKVLNVHDVELPAASFIYELA